MKRTLLMVDHQAPDAAVEAEPIVIETDGRIVVLTLPDGARLAADADDLRDALTLPQTAMKAAA